MLRAAIVAAFPGLSGGKFTLFAKGWDCLAVDVDDRLIFKFPRHETGERALRNEAGLLAVIGPAVTMAVPDPSLHPGPPMFSRYIKLPGEHLLTAHYERLDEAARQRLAAEMALFFSQLHALDPAAMKAAGAGPVEAWLAPDEMLRKAWPVLPPGLRGFAEDTVAAWRDLPLDPHGTTYGFFDGHGWNMAFDHAAGRLNGIYDFGDSGFGELHREFVSPNWISRDLTARIVAEYERLTGRSLDRRRIDLLSGVLRLSQLAEYADDPEHRPEMLSHVVEWAEQG